MHLNQTKKNQNININIVIKKININHQKKIININHQNINHQKVIVIVHQIVIHQQIVIVHQINHQIVIHQQIVIVHQINHQIVIHQPSSTPSITKVNKSQIPTILFPNVYVNYTRYKHKLQKAQRRKQLNNNNNNNNNNKKKTVSLAVDIRTYTSELAATTQIINICKGTSLDYRKRGGNQNWEKDCTLTQFINIYIESNNADLFSSLYSQGVEGIIFQDFLRKLEKKKFASNIEKFIRKSMKALLLKMIRKHRLDDIISAMRKKYNREYFGVVSDDEEKNDIENEKNDIPMFWKPFVTKHKFDELKIPLMVELNAELEEEEDEGSDFIDLSLSNTPQPLLVT
eukprot:157771_1